jgi:hypothetical protein
MRWYTRGSDLPVISNSLSISNFRRGFSVQEGGHRDIGDSLEDHLKNDR